MLDKTDIEFGALMSMAFDAWLAEKDKYRLGPCRTGEELAAFIYGHVLRCHNPDCDLCLMADLAEKEDTTERCSVATCMACRVVPIVRFMKKNGMNLDS
jgi:hypothetical protein